MRVLTAFRGGLEMVVKVVVCIAFVNNTRYATILWYYNRFHF